MDTPHSQEKHAEWRCDQLSSNARREAIIELIDAASNEPQLLPRWRIYDTLARGLLKVFSLDSDNMLEVLDLVCESSTSSSRAEDSLDSSNAPKDQLRGILGSYRPILSKAAYSTSIANLCAKAVSKLLAVPVDSASHWASALAAVTQQSPASLHPYVADVCCWLASALQQRTEATLPAEIAFAARHVAQALTTSLSSWPGSPESTTEALRSAGISLEAALADHLTAAPGLSALFDSRHFSWTCILSECLHSIVVCITGHTEKVKVHLSEALEALSSNEDVIDETAPAIAAHIRPCLCQQVWTACALIGCAGTGPASLIEESDSSKLVQMLDSLLEHGPLLLRETLACCLAPLLRSPCGSAESQELIIRRLAAGLTSGSRPWSRRCLEVLSRVLEEEQPQQTEGTQYGCSAPQLGTTSSARLSTLLPEVLTLLQQSWSSAVERQALEVVGALLRLELSDPALAVSPALAVCMSGYLANADLAARVCNTSLALFVAKCLPLSMVSPVDLSKQLTSQLRAAIGLASARHSSRFGPHLSAAAFIQLCSQDEAFSRCVLDVVLDMSVSEVATCTGEPSGPNPAVLSALLVELVTGLPLAHDDGEKRPFASALQELSQHAAPYLLAEGGSLPEQVQALPQSLERLCLAAAVVSAGINPAENIAETMLEATEAAEGDVDTMLSILRSHVPLPAPPSDVRSDLAAAPMEPDSSCEETSEHPPLEARGGLSSPASEPATSDGSGTTTTASSNVQVACDASSRQVTVTYVYSEKDHLHQSLLHLTRRELQKLSKERKIKANTKSLQMVADLEAHFINTPEDRPNVLMDWLGGNRLGIEEPSPTEEAASDADNTAAVELDALAESELTTSPPRKLRRLQMVREDTPVPRVSISEQLSKVIASTKTAPAAGKPLEVDLGSRASLGGA
mmetsp:Transcript_40763/g.95728  ORF Transcript_40763/g.95728 Transcript_40763/m.95728 type:complete len:916 (+) Transcript_40763:24-2771(+)